ncbi:MAG TPA: GNAT family N-acetyltransferase [Usitatibacter sp.]
MNAAPIVARLRDSERESLATHFIALDGDDRRLRFGTSIADEALRGYTDRIDFDADGVFAVHDDDLRLIAVVHVAVTGASAEFGLSVLPGFRDEGLGSELFARAVMHLRNRGVREVFVHCITENAAMMHLARKHGMRVVPAGAETDACLELAPSTPHSIVTEWMRDQQAQAIQNLRRSNIFGRALVGIFPLPR